MEGGHRLVIDWVFCAGTFDLFHAGHVNLLRQARGFGRVVAAVNTDEFAEEYKRRPILSLEERLDVVRACEYADETLINVGGADCKYTIDYLETVYGIKVRYIVHGDDWMGLELMRQMGLSHGWLSSKQIELRYVPYTEGISSSEIERRILERGLS